MRKMVTILGVPIDVLTMQEAVEQIEDYIAKGTPHMIATANAEMIMAAQHDAALLQILQAADLVVADGAGVVWAASHLGTPVPERVAGFDLAQSMMARAAEAGYRVYFLGSAPGIAEKAKQSAMNHYPGLNIVGIEHGYFTDQDEAEVIQRINHAQPHILFVALGVPRQEKWIYRHLHQLQTPVVMGVGGTLDVMAGVMRRAPVWMQRARLEWLFRLCMQPKRAIRMMALPRFAYRILHAKKD